MKTYFPFVLLCAWCLDALMLHAQSREVPTLRSLLADATAGPEEYVRVLSLDELWNSDSSQAITGLRVLLKKDEVSASPIRIGRFDGWAQPEVGWVNTSEKAAEPYSLADVLNAFDAFRAQRLLDWLASPNFDKQLTFSQRARRRRAIIASFGSRGVFDAALLSAASKQPNCEEAATRVRTSSGCGKPDGNCFATFTARVLDQFK